LVDSLWLRPVYRQYPLIIRHYPPRPKQGRPTPPRNASPCRERLTWRRRITRVSVPVWNSRSRRKTVLPSHALHIFQERIFFGRQIVPRRTMSMACCFHRESSPQSPVRCSRLTIREAHGVVQAVHWFRGNHSILGYVGRK